LQRLLLSIFLINTVLLQGCSLIPYFPGRGIVRDSAEKLFSHQSNYADISYERLRNNEIELYVNDIAQKLAKASEQRPGISISILKTARVQGTMDWNTGEASFTRGMLNMAENEGELACLIGHEIGHLVLNHKERRNKYNVVGKLLETGSQVSNRYGYTLVSLSLEQDEIFRYGLKKELEEEADRYGAELAAKCGYNPYAFCCLFNRLAGRVDANLIYRIKKIKGTHPALDTRAKKLRKYLLSKKYPVEDGMYNRARYFDHMKALLSIRTGEGSYAEDKSCQKDYLRLLQIQKEISNIKASHQRIEFARFMAIMQELSQISRQYGFNNSDFVPEGDSPNSLHFMQEALFQDVPYWSPVYQLRSQMISIFQSLGGIGIGMLPVIGDVVDVYEFFSGKDFITGEQLNPFDRMLCCVGMVCGSGKAWRSVESALTAEIAQNISRDIVHNSAEATQIVKEVVKDIETVTKPGRRLTDLNDVIKTLEKLEKTADLPVGREYEGRVIRYCRTEHKDTLWSRFSQSEGRYNKTGTEVLYVSKNIASNLAEAKYYRTVEKLSTLHFSYRNLKIDNMLDLTDKNVRKKLGVQLSDLTGDNRNITQTIGDFALKNGYDGIIAPSARLTSNGKLIDDGVNFVLFLKAMERIQ
jgi:hypothetical protein